MIDRLRLRTLANTVAWWGYLALVVVAVAVAAAVVCLVVMGVGLALLELLGVPPADAAAKEGVIVARSGQTIDCGGDTVRIPKGRRGVVVSGARGVTIRNCVLVGTNRPQGDGRPGYRYDEDHEGESAIFVQRSSGVTIEAVRTSATWGDGVQIRDSSNVTVRASTIANTGRQGVSARNSTKVTVERSRLANIRRSSFDVEHEGASSVALRDSTVGPTRFYVANFVRTKGARVEGNDLRPAGHRAVVCKKRGTSGLVVRDNRPQPRVSTSCG